MKKDQGMENINALIEQCGLGTIASIENDICMVLKSLPA
jgi:hypothetical protein